MTTVDKNTNEAIADEPIQHLEIDTRRKEWCIDQIKLIEVIRAAQIEHKNDIYKSITAMRGNLLGLFKLESDDYSRYKDKTITIRGVELKFIPRLISEKRPHSIYGERKEGLFVTIYDAYNRFNRHLSDKLFDDYFNNMEGVVVIKQTTPQFTKETRCLNNNRYLVLQLKDDNVKDVIGSSIQVEGTDFNIVYNGMQKHCYLCRRKHGRDCPTRARFEHLKKIREGKTKKRKVYSDSSLRHTNQLALSTDVACTSGGGIGQICNMIPVDQKHEKHEEVVIFAGNNEVTKSTPEEFVYTVTKASEKLKQLATEVKVILVLPTVPPCCPAEEGKLQYLEEKMNEIKEIATYKLEGIEYDGNQPNPHPTQDATLKIFEQIEQYIDEPIILGEKDDVTTIRKYSQVQSLYKVGCRGCDSDDYTAALCIECKRRAQTVDATLLNSIINAIQEKEFPVFNGQIIEQDIRMKEVLKRACEDYTEVAQSPKNARNE